MGTWDGSRQMTTGEGEALEPAHTREVCLPCRTFDPPWRSGGIRDTPEVKQTPFQLLEGLAEIVRQLAAWEGAAFAMRGEFPVQSRSWLHAEGFRQKFHAEKTAFEHQRRKWRSYIDAHPHLAGKPISTPCQHATRNLPTCWDGAAGMYVREVGDDTDDLFAVGGK